MTHTKAKAAVVVDPYSSGAFYASAFRKAGIPVIAVTSSARPPDVYADSFRPEDFSVVRIADPGRIDDIVSELKSVDPLCVLAGCESGVELADSIAYLALPGKANDPDLAAARRHKGAMAVAIERAGVPSMRQICSRSVGEVEAFLVRAGLVGQPLVIKPPKSASTDGLMMIPAGGDWRTPFSCALDTTNRLGILNTELVVQEYLTGIEYAVDMASLDGRHVVCSICRYNKIQLGSAIAIYDTMDWMSPDFIAASELTSYAFQVLDAVGIRSGSSHVEIMMTDSGPRLIEVAARPHGGGHPRFCEEATGDNQVDRVVRSLVSGSLDVEPYKLRRNVKVVFLHVAERSYVNDIAAIEKIKLLESHHYSACKIRNGTWIEPTTDLFGSLAIGLVVLANSNARKLESDYQRVREYEAEVFSR